MDRRYTQEACPCRDPFCAGCAEAGPVRRDDGSIVDALRRAHRPMPSERRMEITTEIVPALQTFPAGSRAATTGHEHAEVRVTFRNAEPTAYNRLLTALHQRDFFDAAIVKAVERTSDSTITVTCVNAWRCHVRDAICTRIAELNP